LRKTRKTDDVQRKRLDENLRSKGIIGREGGIGWMPAAESQRGAQRERVSASVQKQMSDRSDLKQCCLYSHKGEKDIARQLKKKERWCLGSVALTLHVEEK